MEQPASRSDSSTFHSASQFGLESWTAALLGQVVKPRVDGEPRHEHQPDADGHHEQKGQAGARVLHADRPVALRQQRREDGEPHARERRERLAHDPHEERGRRGEHVAAGLVQRNAPVVRLDRAEQVEAGGDVDGAVRLSLGGAPAEDVADRPRRLDKLDSLRTNRREVVARSTTQAAYIKALLTNELVVGTGPAGTGKTYLAVAAAAAMLAEGRVDRIILSRPAVEAGESLGFLPGDMRDKVDPYLRPLYDALYDMLPGPQVSRSLESGEIEIAPLAFMRGRTLSNAFIILDESQNATPMQMKMFLTRMGENSRMVITGDPSQVDLPFGAKSGLKDALEILPKIRGVEIIRFGEEDVVRHDMVTRIVKAYNKRDAKLPQRTADKSARKRALEAKNPSLLDDGGGAGQQNEQK